MTFFLESGKDRSTAVIEDGVHYTYATLRNHIESYAASLHNSGPVGIVMTPRFHSIAFYLACLAARRPVIVLPATSTLSYLTKLTETFHVSNWLVPQQFGEITAPFTAASLTPEHLLIRTDLETAFNPDLALLLPTSGTTGNPKLVRISFENLRFNTEAVSNELDISPSDRAITSVSMGYAFGLSVLHTHLHRGASLVLTSHPLTSRSFWTTARETSVTAFSGVPYSYELLLKFGKNWLEEGDARSFTQAGGKMNVERVQAIGELANKFGATFRVMYGQTEATSRMSIGALEDWQVAPDAAGFALRGSSFAIEPTAEDPNMPEIVYKGPNVSMGYALGKDHLGFGNSNEGVLRTGDIGRLDSDGRIYVEGRKSRFAKINGLRINLDDLERFLNRTSAHGEVAVVESGGRILVCSEGEVSATDTPFAEILQETFGIHKSVVKYLVVPEFSRTGNGKIQYFELERLG